MVALNMIVKNEERSILRCLNSVKSLVQEMVIVDTGSTDRTLDILRKFKLDHSHINVKIIYFEWGDDFSKARNFGIEHTESDYIITLDADEFFLESTDKLALLIEQANRKKLFEFPFVNIVGETHFENDTAMKIVRVFPNSPNIRYIRPVHESLSIIGDGNFELVRAPIKLYHDGYDPGVSDQVQKKINYINMLNKAIQDDPNDDWSYFYLARTIGSFDRPKAKNLLSRLLSITSNEQVKRVCEDYLSKM